MIPKQLGDTLIFRLIPTGCVTSTLAARVKGTTVMVDQGGRIYSSQARRDRLFTLGESQGFDDTLKACIRLGVITRATYRAHLEAAKAHDVKETRAELARNILSHALVLGVKITQAQTKALDKIIAVAP